MGIVQLNVGFSHKRACAYIRINVHVYKHTHCEGKGISVVYSEQTSLAMYLCIEDCFLKFTSK